MTKKQSLECKFCHKHLSNTDSLRKHVMRHTGEAKLHKCNTCEFSTYYKSVLTGHIQAKHTFTTPKVKCEKCTKLIIKGHYKEHLKIHDRSMKKHECTKCHMRFVSLTGLRHHEVTHSTVKRWICKECNKSYTTNFYLQQHIESVHQKKRYECNICLKLFTLKCSLRDHMKIHNSKKTYKCNKCDFSTLSKGNLRRHLSTHGPGKQCTFCDKVIYHERSFERHLQKHTGDAGLHKCELCEFSTYRRDYLKTHVAKKHTSEIRKIRCDQCGILILKEKYDAHLTRHEGKAKRNECGICQMCFSAAEKLRNHGESVHNSIKTWTCKKCNQSYASKQGLQQHIQTIHEQKRFDCQICLKQLSTKHALSLHIKQVHTRTLEKFSCVLCEKSYTIVDTLRKHMVLHSNKASECHKCQRVFSSKRNLQRHLKSNVCGPQKGDRL